MTSVMVALPAPDADAGTLPAGEVTFLFSDIEGSTQAWERHSAAMPAALARHQRIVHDAVHAHGGSVVKDTGDGMFAVFRDAVSAVLAAIDAQRGLRSAVWGETGELRARMGLHTAEAEPEHGDYHGVPVNRCARIMGVAHGGQVLVSETTYGRVALGLPPDVAFLDLGRHRLRDLSVAVQLLQVLHPDLDAEFPPVRSLDVVPNNLPAELSSLVGREQELAELADSLGRTRLLTLTGAGGIGKTRLALQLAADRSHVFADGVWVTELGGLSEPRLVAQAVASALQIAEQPGRSWADSVVWFLRDRNVLLVLDNCEHLLDAVASLTQLMLERCPGLTVLATSREPLNTPGEVAWVVPPLALPDGVRTSDAERLFIERAGTIAPKDGAHGGDRNAVADICRRLDGLPLAIELAAARVRVLSPTEIADRLDDRFHLLTGGARTALPRQRTLEATVAWSYDMLDEPERRLFERLSVFAGGFTLAAVEQVCVLEPIEPSEVLDLLTALTDRSLVVHEQAGPQSRYRLLDTMRAYAADRLVASSEMGRLRDAHLAWANSFARAAEPHLKGREQQRWLGVVAAELDNVRAALTWALSDGDGATGLGCAASLFHYWYVRGVREGRLWLDRLLEAVVDPPPSILAKALDVDGILTEFTGNHEAACARHERALDVYRTLAHHLGEAWALHGLGVAEWSIREPGAVKQRFEQALPIFRDAGDPLGLAWTLLFLTFWEDMYGDVARAAAHVEENESVVQRLGMPLVTAHHVGIRAFVRWRIAADEVSARRDFCTAVTLFSQIASVFSMLQGLQVTANWACLAGHAEFGATLLGAVAALRADAGTPIAGYERVYHDEACARARAELGPERFEAARARGATYTIEAAIAETRKALGCPRRRRGPDGTTVTSAAGVDDSTARPSVGP